MTEDLNLPEDIDLGLDDVSENAAALPDDDFNLDDFLTESAVDLSEEDNLDLNQEEINLEQMLGEKEADTSVMATAEEDAPEAVDVEPATDAEPEIKPETSGWLADEENAVAESAPVSEETFDMSVSPAFDGIEDAAAQESESDVSYEPEAVGEPELEAAAAAESEPVLAASSSDEPEKGWAFDGVETVPDEENAELFNEEDTIAEAPAEAVALNTSLAADVEVPAYDIEETAGFARWYSGNYDDAAFELDRHSVSDVLQGDESRQVIHINVGYDTYGWQVQFADGVSMNLRDVREYQLRNGRLPNPNGTIIYGDMKMIFSNIEKITIYENIRYFSYAPN